MQFRGYKLVYRRYAHLYFMMCIDVNDNELAALEAIHLFVEILDHYFGQVTELDIVLSFHQVRPRTNRHSAPISAASHMPLQLGSCPQQQCVTPRPVLGCGTAVRLAHPALAAVNPCHASHHALSVGFELRHRWMSRWGAQLAIVGGTHCWRNRCGNSPLLALAWSVLHTGECDTVVLTSATSSDQADPAYQLAAGCLWFHSKVIRYSVNC